MRRELIIAAAVLVPFAALVAAGFYFEPKPAADASMPVNPSASVTASPLPAGGEGQGEGKPSPAPAFDAGVAATPPPDLPPELRAPIQAILPEVRRCFADQHLRTPHAVKVHFTPTRDGGFSSVSVDEQNPYLQACLEDVFAEVSWTPAGPETFTPATHTFSFGPLQE